MIVKSKGDHFMSKFKIFADSCSDLSTELRKANDVSYFRMNVVVAGEEKPADLDWNEFSPEQLYAWVGDLKNHCKTTLVPGHEFESKMRPLLEQGYDILYIACSGKLTGSMNTFNLVKSELQDEFPDRKMIGIDSLCASMGEGLLALEAARLQKEGKSLEEVVEWVEANKCRLNQWATVETLSYLKAAGRVSGASAFFGNIIGVKPIIISDLSGYNYVPEKVKGTKNALNKIFEGVKSGIEPGVTKTVYIGQGMAQDKQAALKERIEKELGLNVVEFWIGPIIGTSCGPGVVGCWYFGKKVEIDSQGK